MRTRRWAAKPTPSSRSRSRTSCAVTFAVARTICCQPCLRSTATGVFATCHTRPGIMIISRREHLKTLLAAAGASSVAPFAPAVILAEAATPAPVARDHERRIQWWREAKFGMFIHWGLYSILGREAWAMGDEDIPIEEYEMLARQFRPVANAARGWARLARESGMRYMVMTTKHHEGFCLFNSRLTDYCAPRLGLGRDLVQEYVDAARAENLRVGFYYSLMDWHHPDWRVVKTDAAARKRFVDYTHGQIRELMSNYG